MGRDRTTKGVLRMGIAGNGFKVHLDSRQVVENFSIGSSLRSAMAGSEALIGVRDIIKLAESEGGLPRLAVSGLSDYETRELLRNATNMDGRRIYSNASVSIRRMDGEDVYSMQLFALSGKVSSIGVEANRVFNALGVGPMQSAPPLLLSYGKYVAVYIPMVVENLDTLMFNDAVRNLERRVRATPSIAYKTPDGVRDVDLRGMLQKARAILGDGNGSLSVIRDGTHRAYLSALQGASQPGGNGGATMVMIEGSSGPAHSIPIRMSDVVLVSEKPEANEDRYPGFVKSEMAYLKSVGVDG